MREATDGFWGTPAEFKGMVLKTHKEGLSVNGKIIPWRSFIQAESIHTELFGTSEKKHDLANNAVGEKSLSPMNQSILAICLTHEYPDVPNPVTFIPVNPKNWFDEFQKKSVKIKDNLGIRNQKTNQAYTRSKWVLYLLVFWGLGVLLFMFVILASDDPSHNFLFDFLLYLEDTIFPTQLPPIPIAS